MINTLTKEIIVANKKITSNPPRAALVPAHHKYLPSKTPHGYGKSRFKTEFIDLAFQFALLGADNIRIASYFGVDRDTLDLWILRKPKFKQALKDGREHADSIIATGMYNRCLGFYVTEEKAIVIKDKVHIVNIQKYIPSDVAAAKFWLCNRQRDKWQHQPETIINNNIAVYEPIIKRFDGEVIDGEVIDIDQEVDK